MFVSSSLARSKFPFCSAVLALCIWGCHNDADQTRSTLAAPPWTNYGSEQISFKAQASTAVAQSDPATAGASQGSGAAYAAPAVGNASPVNNTAQAIPDPFGGSAGAGSTMGPQVSPTATQMPSTPVPTSPSTADSDAGLTTDAGSVSPHTASAFDAGGVDAAATGSDSGVQDAGVLVSTSAKLQSVTPELCEIPDFGQIPEGERQLENPFRDTDAMMATTFSIDSDSASYTLARAAIKGGTLPDRSMVRIEEFLNYFDFHYARPGGDVPFALYSELGQCPWNPQHDLLMVGLQGQDVPLTDQPAANLVFLVDVSGSMGDANKLPLLKQGLRMITRQLRPMDSVSIVTYSTTVQLALPATAGNDQSSILNAINRLSASGATAGQAGIQKAYEVAQEHFIQGGNNRVLLATDGDFNVGINTTPELAKFISQKRDTGVFLSVYGFGSPTGNFQDDIAETLADNGNGIYFFIDSPEEARRAFVHTLTGSLLTVAKDVKLQVQFNAEQVRGYRLIGYENRVLANSDFANDSVDAGELGSGLSVTAFFELIPAASSEAIPVPAAGTDPLDQVTPAGDSQLELEPITGVDLAELRVRYKGADATRSELLTTRVTQAELRHPSPSLKFAFAAGLAEFAMQLRGSQYLQQHRQLELLNQVRRAQPAATDGAVTEVIELAQSAYDL